MKIDLLDSNDYTWSTPLNNSVSVIFRHYGNLKTFCLESWSIGIFLGSKSKMPNFSTIPSKRLILKLNY